jgi:hypothetical protein
MPVDRTKLERLITEQVDAIEADYGGDCELGNVTCVVEVRLPDGFEIRNRYNGHPMAVLGMLELVRQELLGKGVEGPGTAVDE